MWAREQERARLSGLHCSSWHLYFLSACFPSVYGNFTGIFPENLSLSGLNQSEPKEEKQADIRVNVKAVHHK